MSVTMSLLGLSKRYGYTMEQAKSLTKGKVS